MENVRMDFHTITGGLTMHSRMNDNSRKHIRHAISIQFLSLIFKWKVADNVRVREWCRQGFVRKYLQSF